jgi:hypothetical protein
MVKPLTILNSDVILFEIKKREFEMKNKSIEDRIRHLEDIHQINNLMGRYEYYHVADMCKEQAELFASGIADVRAEISGVGVWEGSDGMTRFWKVIQTKGDPRGVMRLHTLTTPVIEVAGDGKTAKGVWISPGADSGVCPNGKAGASWTMIKYGIDFIKENGRWKFWHYHLYQVFSTPYERNWTEVAPSRGPAKFPEELKPNRPSIYSWIYRPDAVTENVPAPPESYETFDDKTAY